jgi:hypothetical protein
MCQSKHPINHGILFTYYSASSSSLSSCNGVIFLINILKAKTITKLKAYIGKMEIL